MQESNFILWRISASQLSKFSFLSFSFHLYHRCTISTGPVVLVCKRPSPSLLPVLLPTKMFRQQLPKLSRLVSPLMRSNKIIKESSTVFTHTVRHKTTPGNNINHNETRISRTHLTYAVAVSNGSA